MELLWKGCVPHLRPLTGCRSVITSGDPGNCLMGSGFRGTEYSRAFGWGEEGGGGGGGKVEEEEKHAQH